jgi:hypothetical protein
MAPNSEAVPLSLKKKLPALSRELLLKQRVQLTG